MQSRLTPEDWIAQCGSAGYSSWPALPYWAVVKQLDSDIAALERDSTTQLFSLGALRGAFVAAFIQSISNLARPTVSDILIRAGIDLFELDEESIWRETRRSRVSELLVGSAIRSRFEHAAATYASSAKDLCIRVSREKLDSQAGKPILDSLSHLEVLGDMHARGAVVALYRDGHPHLIYKPRSLASDLVLSDLLEVLRQEDPDYLPIHPTSWDRGDYGWQEFVSFRSPEDPIERRSFFSRFGGLVALTYACSMTDLHYENIKCVGMHPVIVDAECLFDFSPFSDAISDDGYFTQRLPSVLDSLLLPNWISTFEGAHAHDPSALGAYPHVRRQAPARVLVRDSNGFPSYEYATVEQARVYENLPLAEGELPPFRGFEEALLEGYHHVSAMMLQPSVRRSMGEILSRRDNVRARYVSRSTTVFTTLLQSGEAYGRAPSQEQMTRSETLPEWIRRNEHAELDSGVVPVFERDLNSSLMRSGTGEVFDSGSTLLSRIQASINGLSKMRLENQYSLIKRSLALGLFDPDWHETPPTASNARACVKSGTVSLPLRVKMIRDLITELTGSARHQDGHVWWPTAVRHDTGRWQLSTTNSGLYDGLGGVTFALGIAALDDPLAAAPFTQYKSSLQSAIERYIDQAHRSGRGIRQWGMTDGPLGALLAIASLAHVHEDLNSMNWVREIGREFAQHDYKKSGWDFISGAAGTVVALSRLARLTGEDSFRILETTALSELVSSITSLTRRDSWTGGMAHGLAGVAVAFSQSVSLMTVAERSRAANNCLTAEAALISSVETRNDLDDRHQKLLSSSWCWGAGGQIQARLLANVNLKPLRSLRRRLLMDVEPSFSMCHGLVGTALLQSSETYIEHFGLSDCQGTDEILEATLASGRLPANEMPEYATVPGLFNGTAGLLVYLCSKRDDASFTLPTLDYHPRRAL